MARILPCAAVVTLGSSRSSTGCLALTGGASGQEGTFYDCPSDGGNDPAEHSMGPGSSRLPWISKSPWSNSIWLWSLTVPRASLGISPVDCFRPHPECLTFEWYGLDFTALSHRKVSWAWTCLRQISSSQREAELWRPLRSQGECICKPDSP